MLYCSFGNGYRLTGNRHYLDVMAEGARNLAGRFNERVGAIQSWGTSRKWQFPVIIDNMMNLEFLEFMAKETGNLRYDTLARRHANTTMANHFRRDYSSYHVVSYDTLTGSHTPSTPTRAMPTSRRGREARRGRCTDSP